MYPAPPPTAPTAPSAAPENAQHALFLLLLRQHERKNSVGRWAALLLYAGLNVAAFYLGVCWLQMRLGEVTLALHELKQTIVKSQA